MGIKNMTIEQKIGQMLLVGYQAGEKGLNNLLEAVDVSPFGNIILFARNADVPEKLAQNISRISAHIKKRTGFEPFVAADQEGGIVMRFTKGFTPLPGAMSMAAAYLSKGISLNDIEILAKISGLELKKVGVNWNLAPVADINSNYKNPVIGVRSFGDRADFVADLAAAYARGLSLAGLMACAKHFPGHGDTALDSHISLPRVDMDYDMIESTNLVPFMRLIKEGIAAVMTSHVVFPAVEKDLLPATLSKAVLTSLLRQKLDFKGLIVTDCLEMSGIADNFANIFVRTVLAGSDVLCISHTASVQKKAFDDILQAVNDGIISEQRIDESVERIISAKERLFKTQADDAASNKLELQAHSSVNFVHGIAQKSLTLIQGSLPKIDGGVFIDVKPVLQTGAENSVQVFPSLKTSLETEGLPIKVLEILPDPSTEAIDEICSNLDSKPVFVALYAMSRHGQQEVLVKKLLEKKLELNFNIVFILMRDPYDAIIIRKYLKDATILCAYEYSALSTKAVAQALSGQLEPSGLCPVALL